MPRASDKCPRRVADNEVSVKLRMALRHRNPNPRRSNDPRRGGRALTDLITQKSGSQQM
jgi:hypothetical protein